MSSLIKLVLLISTVFCKIICKYFLFSGSWSFVLAYLGMSASGMELAKLIVYGPVVNWYFPVFGKQLRGVTLEPAPADLLGFLILSHRVHRCNWHVSTKIAWNIFSI